MQLQNVNTSRYLEIENDILKRGIKMPNNHIQDIIDSVLPQISFKSNKVLISEIGDGNLNYIYRIKEIGTQKSIIIKVAQYESRISKDILLDISRSYFEYSYYSLETVKKSNFSPQILYANPQAGIIVMEDLVDYCSLREALISMKKYQCISDNISMYLRCVLIENATFNPNDKLEKLRYKFRGNRLSELTKQLIFIEPYNNIKKRNKVPAELESWVKEHIYHNDRLNAKVESLREVFENEEQSIIHGDLHTGSFMVNNDQVKVIDPEFACWGPIGFDLGCLLANLIIDYLFHLTNNEEYCLFIIKIIYNILSTFEKDLSEKIPKNYKTIMIDSAAYAGTEIIRRTIGIALAKEVSIMDEKGNNIAFRKNLLIIGIDLIPNSEKYGSCENFIKRIKKLHVN